VTINIKQCISLDSLFISFRYTTQCEMIPSQKYSYLCSVQQGVTPGAGWHLACHPYHAEKP